MLELNNKLFAIIFYHMSLYENSKSIVLYKKLCDKIFFHTIKLYDKRFFQ